MTGSQTDYTPGKAIDKEKIKAIFGKIDVDNDGWLTKDEFRGFIKDHLGIRMTELTLNKFINQIDKDRSKKIDFQEFCNFYAKLTEGSHQLNKNGPEVQRRTSQKADIEDTQEQLQEKQRLERVNSVYQNLQTKLKANPNSSLNTLIKRNRNLRRGSIQPKIADRFLNLYACQEIDELSDYIYERWKAFVNFNRQGSTGTEVMTSGNDATDALPGQYDLVDLVMEHFGEVPHKVPKHAIIKPVKWVAAQKGQRSGQLICPSKWNRKIPVDIGTSQLLGYYGATIADEKQEKVALLQRHGTMDFTYASDYHQNYVMAEDMCGGNGIETHGFHHMDCPLDENSGYFILAKWHGEDELHLTAFYIPKNHVLYVPPNAIHSNDHLKGKWRTMLSDSDDAPIDHVTFKVRETIVAEDVNNNYSKSGTDATDGREHLKSIDIEFDAGIIESIAGHTRKN